jgi:hypothetical protein
MKVGSQRLELQGSRSELVTQTRGPRDSARQWSVRLESSSELSENQVNQAVQPFNLFCHLRFDAVMPLSLLVVGLLGTQAEVTRFGVHHKVLYLGASE